MPKYDVPITYTINGSIQVEAPSRKAAIKAAKNKWDDLRFKQKLEPIQAIDMPDTCVDFANGDDPNEVVLSFDDTICPECGQPKNNSLCQRSHS